MTKTKIECIDLHKLQKTLIAFPSVELDEKLIQIVSELLKVYVKLKRTHKFKVTMSRNIPIEIEAEIIFSWDGILKHPFKLRQTKLTSINKLDDDQQALIQVYEGEHNALAFLGLIENTNKLQDQLIDDFAATIVKIEDINNYPRNLLYKTLIDQTS